SFLLPLLLLYLLLDFLLDRFQVERSGRLHWRGVDRCLGALGDGLLHPHESPELPSGKNLSITKSPHVRRFATYVRRPFERVLSDVDEHGHVRRGLLTRPAPGLLEECELEVIQPNRAQVRAPEVEQLMTRRRPFAFEQIHLVIAIQVILVSPV